MVDSLLDNFVDSDEFMVVAEACHLWIRVRMLLEAVLTQCLLMSPTVLSDLLIMGTANRKGLG